MQIGEKRKNIMKFQIVCRRILSIFAIIQFGKNYFRYNISFKMHIGTSKLVKNCGFYIILSYPPCIFGQIGQRRIFGYPQKWSNFAENPFLCLCICHFMATSVISVILL